MPAEDDRMPKKLESRPLTPISMPEYRYQDYVVTEHTSSVNNARRSERKKEIDLRGVSLNLV